MIHQVAGGTAATRRECLSEGALVCLVDLLYACPRLHPERYSCMVHVLSSKDVYNTTSTRLADDRTGILHYSQGMQSFCISAHLGKDPGAFLRGPETPASTATGNTASTVCVATLEKFPLLAILHLCQTTYDPHTYHLWVARTRCRFATPTIV